MKFHLGFFLTPKLSYFLLSLFVYFSYKLTKEKPTNLPTYKTYELTKLQNFKLTIYSKQSTSSFFFLKNGTSQETQRSSNWKLSVNGPIQSTAYIYH